jgi:DNA end-binding protein Ku
MAESGKVAIATLVMHNKEYLVAIRPDADVLALETMFFADEVRSPTNELPNLPGATDMSAQELKMANLLIGAMASEWESERYHDTHRAKVEALIEEKAQGKVIVNAGAKSRPATKVVDLMEALSASIAAQSPGEKPPTKKPAPAKAPAKRAPAKFTAAKKSAKTPAAKPARRKAS